MGGVKFSRKKPYEGVRFNVISVTRGWVGAQFPEKKCYVTLEWPHCHDNPVFLISSLSFIIFGVNALSFHSSFCTSVSFMAFCIRGHSSVT